MQNPNSFDVKKAALGFVALWAIATISVLSLNKIASLA